MASPEVIVTAVADYGFCRSVSGDGNAPIKKGQCYYLVSRHSDDWWIIRHPEFDNDVYAPADYVEEIGGGLSPSSVLGEDESALKTNDENHNEEPQYANLAAIQGHIHRDTEDENGHLYENMRNAKEALKRPPPKPSKNDQPLDSIGEHWLVYLDQSCDRKYYINTKTGESTWKPPRGVRNKVHNVRRAPIQKINSFGTTAKLSVDDDAGGIPEGEETVAVDTGNYVNVTISNRNSTNLSKQLDKRASMPVVNIIPDGWQEHHSDGQTYYVHEVSREKWVKYESDDGRFYYCNATGGESLWQLPLMKQLDASSSEDLPSFPSVSKPLPPLPPNAPNLPVIKTTTESESDRTSPSFQEPVNFNTVFAAGVETRRGYLNKKKVVENGKKINFRKNWSQSFVVVSDLILYFYKDEKSYYSQNKPSSPPGKPEFLLDLTGAVIKQNAKGDAMKLGVKGEIKSSKKNLILVMTQESNGYFLQHEDEEVIHRWYTILSNNVTILSKQSATRASQGSLGSLDSELGLDDFTPSPAPKRKGTKKERSNDRQILDDPNISITEKKGTVIEFLRTLIPKRPDVSSLQARGIIKDAVFGCQSITKLCEREKSTIPNFVEACLIAIEAKGLDTDGIYRISGNLATIQKLRFMIDQDVKCDLQAPEMDVNTLTGALKLFFRELKEPLFPCNQYEAFVNATMIKNKEYRVKAMSDQIKKLPKANRETMKRLFGHLCKVVELKKENRMQVQNVAIIFGPTLMWPEANMGNMALDMVYQNQVVECILSLYSRFF